MSDCSTHVCEVMDQPVWAIAFAVLLFLILVVLLARRAIRLHEHPVPTGTRLFLVAFDYPAAADWCWRHGISINDPDVIVLTRVGGEQGYRPKVDDEIIDLHGPRTVLHRLTALQDAARS